MKEDRDEDSNPSIEGPTPPSWCEPDTQPNWDSLTPDGAGVLSWTHDIGAVWIACDDTIVDGEWVRSPAAIGFGEPPAHGLDPGAARRLAADLLNAADLLDG
jgi:hypothetical protein